MTRLPENYELTKSTGGNYTKLQEGTTKIRILTSPIVGWEYFNQENRPIRQKVPFDWIPSDSKEWRKPKEFRAFVVWNYEEKSVQVMEITQKSLKDKLYNYVKDPDFWDPKTYDLKFSKTGKGLDTEYDILALGKSEFDNAEALEKAKAIRLDALYEGEDPFKPF